MTPLHREKIVVVSLHHGLGDALMAVPLLRGCDRALGEKGTIIVIHTNAGIPSILRLLQTKTRIEGIRVSRAPVQAGWAALKLRTRNPDIFMMPFAVDHARLVPWTGLIGARISVGPEHRWGRVAFTRRVLENRPGFHKVDILMQYGVAAGLWSEMDADVRIPLPENLLLAARTSMPGWHSDQKWIALAPGSGVVEQHKRWPPGRFQELALQLLRSRSDLQLAIVGTREELPLLNAVAQGCVYTGRVHVITPSVAESISIFANCACVVCGCSGASHLAAAAGTTTVGIYGPTNPGWTGPYNVLHVVRRGLACSPCYRNDFIRGCGNPVCMTGISADTVFRAVSGCLGGPAPGPVPWLPSTDATQPEIDFEDQRQPGFIQI